MNKLPDSIPKQPTLKIAEDYYQLRRVGIGFIEKMASEGWTDYNTHDPGITILEALCFTITDLAYRANWDIQDLLTPENPPADSTQPFPNQAFFTARDILTVNPVTPDDFRRLLIDLVGVRNAWVLCSHCSCEFGYYTNYQNGQLQLSYQPPQPDTARLSAPKKVELNGLYEVLLELEADPEFGDLNDHKIEHSYTVFDNEGNPHSVILEMRFPNDGLARNGLFNNKEAAFKLLNVEIATSTAFNKLTVPDLRNHWRNVFFVRFTIKIKGEKNDVTEQAAIRLFGDITAKNDANILTAIQAALNNAGFIDRYWNKLLKINEAVEAAKTALQQHRNLDEEFCHVNSVNIEDIAVCADIEVTPDADIERVQAQIWFEIENYFNPPIRFYSLQELLDNDTPVETIFNGPVLNCGFIKDDELQAAELRTTLRTSDIINRLVHIDGVVAVNNLLLSKYDAEGRLVKGQADPTETGFDSNKTSAAWVLTVKDKHQPRLYHNLSRFLFFKNGLPFMPRMDEAYQTLTQLHGEAERQKIKEPLMDLPIPSGIFRNPEDYFPLQYSFPLTYGIGTEGLPAGASPERKAQAKQLKAYLMVFEQLLVNALAQLTHAGQLFSLDYSIDRTYFVRELGEKLIQGYDGLLNGFNKTALQAITETPPEFHQRRNRFLDHIMARFGEQFGEYAMLLTNYNGQQVALDRLIEDKISFLKAYPLISSGRSKAFNFKDYPSAPDNFPVLKKRVSLLLGYPNLAFVWNIAETSHGHYKAEFQLTGQNYKLWLTGKFTLPADDISSANAQAYGELMTQIIKLGAYKIVKKTGHYKLKLTDVHHRVMAQVPSKFDTKTEAIQYRDELVQWGANERAIIVEHLLLRPKFPGDALYPVHADDACNLCADIDPYSFRLTFVMPGWTAPYNINMEMRRFAERTIRQETPAHILAKICWVDNTGVEFNPCGVGILETIAELLEKDASSVSKACECAKNIFKLYNDTFKLWFDPIKTQHWLKITWELKIAKLFKKINKHNLNCAGSVSEDTWQNIHNQLLAYFTDIALYGWQFERFETAWYMWLEANAKIDWTEVCLQERVLAILKAGIDTTQPMPTKKAICNCAAKIIGGYAEQFYTEMQNTIADPNGLTWKDFKLPELEIKSFSSLSLSDKTKTKLTDLLIGKNGLYTGWIEVSYRLWIVVNLLSQLRNTYPGATLHDCDDGSDQNPVRLGSTALGNYPLRSSAN
ncbi:MAG: hypothetical protein WCS87_00870 [Methylococcaceae bacterium]